MSDTTAGRVPAERMRALWQVMEARRQAAGWKLNFEGRWPSTSRYYAMRDATRDGTRSALPDVDDAMLWLRGSAARVVDGTGDPVTVVVGVRRLRHAAQVRAARILPDGEPPAAYQLLADGLFPDADGLATIDEWVRWAPGSAAAVAWDNAVPVELPALPPPSTSTPPASPEELWSIAGEVTSVAPSMSDEERGELAALMRLALQRHRGRAKGA